MEVFKSMVLVILACLVIALCEAQTTSTQPGSGEEEDIETENEVRESLSSLENQQGLRPSDIAGLTTLLGLAVVGFALVGYSVYQHYHDRNTTRARTAATGFDNINYQEDSDLHAIKVDGSTTPAQHGTPVHKY